MSTLINRVKDHISDNRGKYGAAAGAGAMYAANQIPSVPMPAIINQAGFNVMANGQNLALDAADKIGYGKEQLQNMGINRIDPEVIDGMNKAINNMDQYGLVPGRASNLTNGAEKLTELKNDYNHAKNQYQTFSDDLDNKAIGYIDQGVNYIKGLNPFSENTIPGKTMKIEIKNALLEGYAPEVIVEAVHANSYSFNKNTAKYNPVIQNNRDILAHNIRLDRTQRDVLRKDKNPITKFISKGAANSFDNGARLKSQDDRFGKELVANTHPTGLIEKDIPYSKEFQNNSSVMPVIKTMLKPRIISSAKQ